MDTVTAFQIDTEARRDVLFEPGRTAARWSSGRHEAIYVSCAASTALLEFLVHQQGGLPSALCCGRLTIPASEIAMLDTLPKQWKAWPYRADVQNVGDEWLASVRQLALRLPSAVAPASFNLLINPHHSSYAACTVQFVEAFRADGRLQR